MDNNESVSTQANPQQRKKWLLLTSLFFILVFVLSFLYWLLILRHQVSTDDAYVAGIQVPIIAQTSGKVTQVVYTNTDYVKQGDPLVQLDKTNATLALQQAIDTLAQTVRSTEQLYIEKSILQAAIASAQITLNQAERDDARRIALNQQHNISTEELQHSKESVQLAQLTLESAKQKWLANQAMINHVDLEKQPAVTQAADAVRTAWLALQRTTIRSPIDGYVARQNVQVGSQVSPEDNLMVIVPETPLWVDANFKETQLAQIKIGQSVTLQSDLYGNEITYQGKVTGINMGTGSAFSLLPAQNATGNWIKVVQRLPVRIDLDPEQLEKYPLRIGLSMNVTVDIQDQNEAYLSTTQRKTPFYSSDALVIDLAEADALIAAIIEANRLSLDSHAQ